MLADGRTLIEHRLTSCYVIPLATRLFSRFWVFLREKIHFVSRVSIYGQALRSDRGTVWFYSRLENIARRELAPQLFFFFFFFFFVSLFIWNNWVSGCNKECLTRHCPILRTTRELLFFAIVFFRSFGTITSSSIVVIIKLWNCSKKCLTIHCLILLMAREYSATRIVFSFVWKIHHLLFVYNFNLR